MKLSKIAIASLLAAGSFSAFAQGTVDACTLLTSTATDADKARFASECAPTHKIYIAGASAMKNAVTARVPTLFTGTVLNIIDHASSNGVGATAADNIINNQPAAGNSVVAWYGMSNPALGTSKPLFVVYNSFNGSAAGVSQLLARTLPKLKTANAAADSGITAALANMPESNVVAVGTAADSCSAYTNTNMTAAEQITVPGTSTKVAPAANTFKCTVASRSRPDVAVSDVDVPELVKIYSSVAKASLTNVVRKPVGMQGFGVAVNNNFYEALQTYQKGIGKLPSTCVAGAYNAECQPSIASAQYASLTSKTGAIKSSAGFIPGDTTRLTLARRDEMSGTQAASEMFFLGTKCNNPAALTPLRTTDVTDFSLRTIEAVQTANVEEVLSSATDYAIGVVTLSASGATAAKGPLYKFVKLDGQSPNFISKLGDTQLLGGAMRTNMVDGGYPFQFTPYVMTLKTDIDEAKGGPKATMVNKLITELTLSTSADLTGISYFNGSTAVTTTNGIGIPGKKSMVSRQYVTTKGVTTISNCAPLTTTALN